MMPHLENEDFTRRSIRARIAWTAFISCGIDLVSKTLVIARLDDHPIRVLGSLLRLHLAFNSGAAFSLAPSATYFFSLFSIFIASITWHFSKKIHSRGWAYIAGLILGGIGGNLLDRIFRTPGFLRGKVVDWIEIPHWPTFNLADTSIFLAALFAVILTFRDIPPHPSLKKKGKVGSDE